MNQVVRAENMWRVLGLLLALWGSAAWAQTVGSVMQLTGTLSAQRGTETRILSMNSEVQRGDTLSTQRASYAQIRFTDGSIATLRPNTTMRVEEYQFNQSAPQADGLVMRLLKGGLRTVTGLIGKRGNQDAYKIETAVATIGIRGSEGDTCATPCGDDSGKSSGLEPGVYHITHTGLYIMVTKAGSILIAPGQIGYASDPNEPPVLLSGDTPLWFSRMPFVLGASDPVQECTIK